MMKKIIGIFILSTVILSCSQSDPDFNQRSGDLINFAGREWDIKHSLALLGPGPNFFSNHPNDVWIDDDGFLHLTVTQRDGEWKCTEVVSRDTFGFGTYVWTIQGDPVTIDRNIVLGLFTWDNNTFQTQANSEVDIEFAKWGDPEEDFTLQYGVQPIAFGPYNEERVFKPESANSNWIGESIHAFTWTDSLIIWKSWPGSTYDESVPPAAEWSFDHTNPAKIKYENQSQSDPIVIPAPGNTTNARMNLWLVNGPEGPFVPIRHEIVIQDFKFIPLP